MTITIFLAIVFMTSLFVILKCFGVWKVNNLHGLTVNYFTASLFAMLHGYTNNLKNLPALTGFYPLCIAMGLLFILIFYVTAFTAQHNGVSAATVASKMSVVVPVLAGIYLYNEPLSATKLIALLFALAAVYFTSGLDESQQKNTNSVLWPLVLFLGAGLVDTAIKYAQATYINPSVGNVFIATVFAVAGISGAIAILFDYLKSKNAVQIKSISAGVLLGICNYLSLVFVLSALAEKNNDSGAVFTIANVGVVLLSALCSYFLFNERLNKKTMTGICLAIIAILILSYA